MQATGLRLSLVIVAYVLISLVLCEDTTKPYEKKSKSVTTFVSAKWEATPIVLELAEYLAGESTDLFWSFFDGINSLKSSLDSLETDKQVYDACIGVASTLLAPAQLRMAKLALSMHLTSPTVRMFDQIATQSGAKEVACDAFVSIASRKICDNDALRDILKSYNQYDVEEHKQATYLLDHSYPSSDNKSLTAILYGELGMKDFTTKHKILSTYADSGAINYVPRGKPKLRLSGYGVELQLKSTEYKSQDDSRPKESEDGDSGTPPSEEEDENDPQNQIDGFNFGRLKNLFPGLRSPLERFRRHLSESNEELAPLKVWQMQALSMQAAVAVVDANDAGGDESLKVLTSIAQNFPMQTKSLIHVNVPRSFREEVLYNQDIWASSLGLRPAEPLLLVSGAQYDAEEVDVMALLAALKEDIGPMNTLHALGLSKKLINKLMSLELGEAYTWEEYGLDIRDTSITWLNDLESDERYRRWPSSYMELLRPTYPGMLRNLRRNIYNYVIIVDPTSLASGPPLKLGETLLKHATPVRVGLVLAPSTDNPELEAAVRSAFNYVAQERNSNKEAYYFLTQLLHPPQDEKLSIEFVKKQLNKYANFNTNINDILSEDSEYNFGRQLSDEFVSKIGTNKYPQVLVNGVPLVEEGNSPVTASVELLEEALVTALSRHTGRLQRAVFRGELSDSDDAINYLMKQPHIMPRLNRRILASEPSQYLDLSGVAASNDLFTEDKIHKLMHLTGRDALATALPILKYFTKSGKPEKVSQTIWVAGDLNNKESRDLLKNALLFMLNFDYTTTLYSLTLCVKRKLLIMLLQPELVPALNKYEYSNQMYADKLSEVLDSKKKVKDLDKIFEDDDDDLEVGELSPDERLKVVCVVGARSPRVRTALPGGLRGDHSLVDLPPLRDDEAAVENNVSLHYFSHSEFELEYLLLEGHAWDTALGTPPRGLQLVLGTRDKPELMDTIVMANLGYFQLKANPGAWILRLRPGRSDDIYEIVGHENTDTPADSEDIQVLMSSFRSHVIKLRVSKKPDKQHLDLLVENDDKNSGGIWNSIASSFGGGEEQEAQDETINVFSVASGHLYERFIRIMMLSVLKHTKSPVKFWFLKNYLSPSLKDILPYMAQEYGFEYELVQYQWPRWLQRQRDRQRTIWGYKILFLDVLFPLHVKKIIFVDADQIVRADLKELVELDLGGAPYGYTPFCDSRKEMEGFRFWKQGYWRNHLQGRSYHISALYVVDLKRFRRIAAGDRLRGQYQALSQDPNSLSNLDQDLPNNMIHQVAIKSLPQEWLWCETWCDNDSKAYAKTIDLEIESTDHQEPAVEKPSKHEEHSEL
ncbi:hypothetical protein HF086_001336 [Spodoptera exigua]|uniref:UDP-glucose:glycoprotein glucosyltransferase n=1 Tax=Spodoptera exigua TaxID=7107 RepID=A0A922MCX1_SPOEX|nr:hypothetical protein HF086_001336 [Spodoptera exigua]